MKWKLGLCKSLCFKRFHGGFAEDSLGLCKGSGSLQNCPRPLVDMAVNMSFGFGLWMQNST